jgi:hypothetical protein
MAHQSHTPGGRHSAGARIRGIVRSLAKNAAFIVLAAGIVATIGVVELASRNAQTQSALGAGGPTISASPTEVPVKVTCDAPGLPVCDWHSHANTEWIPIKSTSAADILAAMKQTSFFQHTQNDSGDHIQDLSRLGMPALVRALQPPTGGTVPDVYMLPVLNSSTAVSDAVQFVLNADHTQLRFSAAITYPSPRAAFVRMTASSSVSAVSAQHNTALRANQQPYLVYFPTHAPAPNSAAPAWTAGGDSPFDPAWLVPGADGKDHIVCPDGSVHYPSELPISL